MPEQRGDNFPRLVEVMRQLLGPQGCPWDREQTFESLRSNVIEEAYEVVEAIDQGQSSALREELGDLLLQVVFQSELAAKRGWFGPNDVVDAVSDKLVRRHPWVFGDQAIDDSSGAVSRWEELKAAEKGDRGALDGVPASLPALLRAVRVGQKASSVGYDWPGSSGARDKIDEELSELDEAIERGDREGARRELGDLLFSIASFARKEGFDPEHSLRETLDRFSARFRAAERFAREQGRELRELDAEELDALWSRAKEQE